MIAFEDAQRIHEWCTGRKAEGLTVGFVPTMGALHEGHVSLVQIARRHTDVVVSSIFVNPTQFNDPSDYEQYPVSLENDTEMLEAAGCDAVFIPAVREIYPQGRTYDLEVDLGYLGECMEAVRRPGHFEGVMQVVKRLLEIVIPDILYLGRKDYQQYRVVSRMVETYGLPVAVEQCPIIREDDGLAMSSRNRRLSPEARRAAVKLSRALSFICGRWKTAAPEELTALQAEWLAKDDLIEVEYLEIVDESSLRPIGGWSESESAVAFIAAWVGGIRLIDNATIY